MKQQRTLRFFLAACLGAGLGAFQPCAYAVVTSVADPVFGPNSLTRDTTQGLDFLDLTLTTNKSYNEVNAQLGPGGTFEGYRFAVESEVIALINHFGFSPGAIAGEPILGDTGGDQLSGLVSLLGQTGTGIEVGTGLQIRFSAGLTSTSIAGPGTLYDVRMVSVSDYVNSTYDDHAHSSGGETFTEVNPGIGAFLVRSSFPKISVEQPIGTTLGNGGAKVIGSIVGTPLDFVFSVKNAGGANLVLSGSPNRVALSGDGSFTLPVQPANTVTYPNGTTTFTLRFAPTGSGVKTTTLTIANNDPAQNPYVVNLVGHGLTNTTDSDGDGLNDAAEIQLSLLGFDWQVAQPAQVSTFLTDNALYTPYQIQALNINTPIIQRNGLGQFKLTLGVEKSTDLTTFDPFPMTAPQTSINAQGKLEFLFTTPDNTEFYRVKAQ